MPESPANIAQAAATAEAAAPGWSPRVRRLVSLALLWHVAALVAAPLAAPPPSSPLARRAAAWFAPYLQALYLNHGYRFFAPNPGPSHLVEYEITTAEGKRVTGVFPDLAQHQPRLLYHRHFMLSETIFSLPTPPNYSPAELRERLTRLDEAAGKLEQLGALGPAAGLRAEQGFLTAWRDGELEPEDRAALEYDRRSRRLLLEAVARELLLRHGGERVVLHAVEHALPPPEEVLAGRPLNHPDYYQRRRLGEFTRSGEIGPASTAVEAEEIAPAAEPAEARP